MKMLVFSNPCRVGMKAVYAFSEDSLCLSVISMSTHGVISPRPRTFVTFAFLTIPIPDGKAASHDHSAMLASASTRQTLRV
jgi:hypothetical protein